MNYTKIENKNNTKTIQEKKYIIDSDLINEWDYEQNNKLNLYPDKLTCGSHKKVHWMCKKNHSWEANINNRINGQGCPYCSNRKVLKKINDLQTTHPNLIKQWDYELNILKPDEISAGSNKKVHWICEKNHKWISTIKDRTNGQGCPYCSNRKVLKGFNDLQTTHPKIAKQWDYELNTLKPDEVSFGSAKKIYWKCEKNHSWQSAIYHRTKKNNCPYCSNRKVLRGFNDLQTVYPNLAKEWDKKLNKLKSSEVISGSTQKAFWICENNHSWEAIITNRIRGSGCPYCNESKGEKQISNILDFYKIKYIRQYKLKDCKNKFPLPFDFAIFKNEILQYLIEYDGRQHFENIKYFGGKKSLLEIQKRDKIKTNYCKKNNIKLIRIKYTEFDDIENILKKELNL